MKDLVSIVVPVYNKDKYISKCLKSIVNQKYKNIEVLVIDDGSEDASQEIINEFIKKDRRIKFFTQKNAGVGNARNRGIQNANGKYILFIDADDEISEDYVANLMKYHDYNLVVSGLKSISINDDKIKQCITLEESVQFLPQNLEVILSHANYPIFSVVCTKLFDLSVIKNYNLKFLPIQYGEDSIFVLAYLSKINSFKTIPYVGYFNNIVSGTLSHKKKNNIWQQAKLIPQKAKEYFNLTINSRIFQFLMLRSVKLSFMNSTSNYSTFRNTFKLIEKENVPQLLSILNFDRRIDKLLIILIKCRLVFLLYLLFKQKN
jgi:glycosyltransferase involved in cell wall biosynthesis